MGFKNASKNAKRYFDKNGGDEGFPGKKKGGFKGAKKKAFDKNFGDEQMSFQGKKRF